MAYSDILEARIDAASQRWKGVVKKKMFGGVCYLLKGNMAFGIWKDFLIVRMDKEQAQQRLTGKNVKPFDITGKPMAGWVLVETAGLRTSSGLAKWLAIGKEFALSLPEKKGKATAKKTKTLREYRG